MSKDIVVHFKCDDCGFCLPRKFDSISEIPVIPDGWLGVDGDDLCPNCARIKAMRIFAEEIEPVMTPLALDVVRSVNEFVEEFAPLFAEWAERIKDSFGEESE